LTGMLPYKQQPQPETPGWDASPACWVSRPSFAARGVPQIPSVSVASIVHRGACTPPRTRASSSLSQNLCPTCGWAPKATRQASRGRPAPRRGGHVHQSGAHDPGQTSENPCAFKWLPTPVTRAPPRGHGRWQTCATPDFFEGSYGVQGAPEWCMARAAVRSREVCRGHVSPLGGRVGWSPAFTRTAWAAHAPRGRASVPSRRRPRSE